MAEYIRDVKISVEIDTNKDTYRCEFAGVESAWRCLDAMQGARADEDVIDALLRHRNAG